MPSVAAKGKNIWLAASDGDLERVKELIEDQGLGPNDPDENTYTPMHAAASYAHIELLEYLLSKGGDVNIKDEDGETPIFTAETVEVAKWLVEHGASIDIKNEEGQTPAEYLYEDHPEVAIYLQSTLNASAAASGSAPVHPSEYQAEQLSSRIADQLMEQTDAIMTQAEQDGTDPEAALRDVVGRAVLNGWREENGMEVDDGAEGQTDAGPTDGDGPSSKRSRHE